jgi:multidrug resistance efflux pump
MRAPRLTPNQARELEDVSKWGETFPLYSSYQWLREKGLVRAATEEEVRDYFATIQGELDRAAAALAGAAQERDYPRAKSLAVQCLIAEAELRKEDELVRLSAAGIIRLSKIKARRAVSPQRG